MWRANSRCSAPSTKPRASPLLRSIPTTSPLTPETRPNKWSTKPKSDSLAALASLAALPNVEIRVFSIPKHSSGEIPFARVAHAKFMIADRAVAWVGTSNWEGDYFTASRNVGVIVEGGALPATLDDVFVANWGSAYASPVVSGPAPADRPSSSDPAPR